MPVKSQRACAAELPGPPFFSSYDLKGSIQKHAAPSPFSGARAIILSEIAPALSESCSRMGASFHDVIRMHFRLPIARGQVPATTTKIGLPINAYPPLFHDGESFAKKAAIPSAASGVSHVSARRVSVISITASSIGAPSKCTSRFEAATAAGAVEK